MPEPEVLGTETLALDAVARIATGGAVRLDPAARRRMIDSHRQVETLAKAGRVVYGLNTGCGPLCDRPVLAADAARFQLNLIRSHASGVGPAHGREVVRATMAVRAQTLAQGRSGVRPVVVESVIGMLREGSQPVLPDRCSGGT